MVAGERCLRPGIPGALNSGVITGVIDACAPGQSGAARACTRACWGRPPKSWQNPGFRFLSFATFHVLSSRGKLRRTNLAKKTTKKQTRRFSGLGGQN